MVKPEASLRTSMAIFGFCDAVSAFLRRLQVSGRRRDVVYLNMIRSDVFQPGFDASV